MKIKTAVLLAIAGLLSVGSTYASDADTSKGHECLFASQPQSWRVLDQRHLVVWAPSHADAYLLELFSPLPDLGFAEELAFLDDDHDGRICEGDKIAVPGSNMTSFPVTITSMRKLNDAELVALGEKYKVKLISDKKAQELKSHDKHIHAEPEPEGSK